MPETDRTKPPPGYVIAGPPCARHAALDHQALPGGTFESDAVAAAWAHHDTIVKGVAQYVARQGWPGLAQRIRDGRHLLLGSLAAPEPSERT